MDTKIKRSILVIGIITSVILSACGQTTSKSATIKGDSLQIKQQQMLKDYFLCSCIDYGFKEDSLFIKKDHSMTVYTELMDYEYDDIQKVKQYAKRIVDNTIPTSNYSGKRGILGSCIEYYRGKELDSLIKSMKIRK